MPLVRVRHPKSPPNKPAAQRAPAARGHIAPSLSLAHHLSLYTACIPEAHHLSLYTAYASPQHITCLSTRHMHPHSTSLVSLHGICIPEAHHLSLYTAYASPKDMVTLTGRTCVKWCVHTAHVHSRVHLPQGHISLDRATQTLLGGDLTPHMHTVVLCHATHAPILVAFTAHVDLAARCHTLDGHLYTLPHSRWPSLHTATLQVAVSTRCVIP